MHQKIIKYIIYALVFLMPLFFLPFTVEALEFNKLYLLAGLTAVGIFVWLAKMIFKDKKISIRAEKFDLFVLGFMLVMGLTVVFAKDKTVSIFGDYGRFLPCLIGILSMGGFYFLVKNNIVISRNRRENSRETDAKKEINKAEKGRPITVSSILNIFLISSGLVIITGLLSMFGVWQRISQFLPSFMAQKSFNPASASLEGLAMLAGFLVVLLVGLLAFGKRETDAKFTPLNNSASNGASAKHALKETLRVATGQARKNALILSIALKYLLLVGVLAVLVIVDFWPVWLMLALSLVMFLGLAFWQRLFKENVNRLGLAILVLTVSLVFLFSSPLRGFIAGNRFLSDLPSEVLLRQTPGWVLAGKAVKDDPVLGSGLGNFSYAFSKNKPEGLMQGNLWQLRLNRAGSHIAETAATTGALGILAYLGLVVMFLAMAWKGLQKSKVQTSNDKSNLNVKIQTPLFFAFLALLIGQFVYYQNMVLAFSFWLMMGLVVVARTESREKTLDFVKVPEIGLVFTVVFWILLVGFAFFGFEMTKQYLAEINYKQYLEKPEAKLANLEKAADHFSQRAVYHIVLSSAYLNEFSRLLDSKEADSQALANVLKSAVDECQKAVEVAPNNVASHEAAGIIYREIQGVAQGTTDWAIKSFENALELEPDNPAFFIELGKLHQTTGEEDKAKQFWQRALEIKPDYTAASLLLASSDEAEGNEDKAIKRLEQAVDKDPWSTEAHFRLGIMYYNGGKYDLAEAQFLTALQIFPNHSNSLYSLALLLERKGDKENAKKLLEKVLELNPGNEDVMDKIESLGSGGEE